MTKAKPPKHVQPGVTATVFRNQKGDQITVYPLVRGRGSIKEVYTEEKAMYDAGWQVAEWKTLPSAMLVAQAVRV